MTEAIVVALISAAVTLVSVFVSSRATSDKVIHTMDVKMAVMQSQIDGMKEDIKEHNHYAKLFAESMPVVKEQVKVINHRIEDLERVNK